MHFMKQFRHGTVWLAVAWFGIALLIYLSLAHVASGVTVAHADKYGHVAAYALLTYWMMQLCEGARSRLVVACALLALGVALEVMQYFTGYRSMEAADAAADALGIALGWLAAPPRTFNILERVEKVV